MDQNMENPAPEEIPPHETSPQSGYGVFSSDRPVVEENKDARQWAMFCHLAALASYLGIPFGHILGPMIVWLIKKDEFSYVQSQGKEALNFQISMTIYGIICVPLICLAGLGFVLLAAVGIVDLVFIIFASINANKGKDYKYPLSIRFLK